MDSHLSRMATDLIARVTGPLHLRLVLQPTMALIFGIRDGWKDAREGQPAYFWAIFTNTSRRANLLESGIHAVFKILVLAVLLDAVYQFIALRWFYPGEAIVVAFLLAFVPYLLIRGPANRIARWIASRPHGPHYRSFR